MASRQATLIPPADSPPTVTRAGSPPNAAMFSCTQRSAATRAAARRRAGRRAAWAPSARSPWRRGRRPTARGARGRRTAGPRRAARRTGCRGRRRRRPACGRGRCRWWWRRWARRSRPHPGSDARHRSSGRYRQELMPTDQPRALVPVLIFLGTCVAVISSLGAPLIPAIAADTGTTLAQAQWALTVTLVTGAVATPVLGRL